MESTDNNEEDITIYFKEKKSGSIIFHIEGLKLGEIAVSEIKNDMYEKITKTINEKAESEPFKTFLAPPYVSIKKVYIEK